MKVLTLEPSLSRQKNIFASKVLFKTFFILEHFIPNLLQRHISGCEEALLCQKVTHLAENISCAAKLANRLFATLRRESDNSEEFRIRQHLEVLSEGLKLSMKMFVESGRGLVTNFDDSGAIICWKSAAIGLLDKVKEAAKVFVNLNMFDIPMYDSNTGQASLFIIISCCGLERA